MEGDALREFKVPGKGGSAGRIKSASSLIDANREPLAGGQI